MVWNGSAYVCSAALHTAGSLVLRVQHNFQDLRNSPLSVTVLPGPLALSQVRLSSDGMKRAHLGCADHPPLSSKFCSPLQCRQQLLGSAEPDLCTPLWALWAKHALTAGTGREFEICCLQPDIKP